MVKSKPMPLQDLREYGSGGSDGSQSKTIIARFINTLKSEHKIPERHGLQKLC
jgi:hypothetical protein